MEARNLFQKQSTGFKHFDFKFLLDMLKKDKLL